MKQKIYLLAIIITTLCLGLYIPRLYTYAQDKAEQREKAQRIMDLELELSDVQAEWQIMDDSKSELYQQIDEIKSNVADIENTQSDLHNRANAIRAELNELNWNHSTASDITNCYEYTWDLYNDCLDAYIQVGLSQRRQPQ